MRALLEVIARHVRQALRLHRRLSHTEGMRAATCDLLD